MSKRANSIAVNAAEPLSRPFWIRWWFWYRWKYCTRHRLDLQHSIWDWEGLCWECELCDRERQQRRTDRRDAAIATEDRRVDAK